MAYVPVYSAGSVYNDIRIEGPKATSASGKIYAYESYLFQVEQYEGIHIIDNTVPKAAHKVAFLKVPQCTELAIKSNHLYTNNLNDLVVFDLSNRAAPQLVKRLAGAFPLINQTYPPLSDVQFQCADLSKGTVVRWEQKLVKNPLCRR
jgi:hypothetical protein